MLNIVPVFEAADQPWQDLFIDELHPSERGHELIAEALVDQLSEWVQSGRFASEAEPQATTNWDDPFARGEGPAPTNPTVARVTLAGRVIGAPEGTPIQIDLINLNPDRNSGDNPMLGSARFDHVDPFEMPAPRSGEFGVRIYLDREGDGPSRGDPVHEFFSPPIQATGTSMSGIVLDLNSDSVHWVNTPPTNARPQ